LRQRRPGSSPDIGHLVAIQATGNRGCIRAVGPGRAAFDRPALGGRQSCSYLQLSTAHPHMVNDNLRGGQRQTLLSQDLQLLVPVAWKGLRPSPAPSPAVRERGKSASPAVRERPAKQSEGG